MPQPVARNEVDKVDGTGYLGTPLQTFVFTNGKNFSLRGEKVAPHPPFPDDPIHGLSQIVGSSNLTFVDGIPIARLGDKAKCGHPIVTGDYLCFSD